MGFRSCNKQAISLNDDSIGSYVFIRMEDAFLKILSIVKFLCIISIYRWNHIANPMTFN